VKQGTSPAVSIVIAFVNATAYKDIILRLNWSNLSLSIGGSSNTQVGGPSNYGLIDVGGGWYRLWCTLTNTYNGNQVSGRIHVRDSGSSNVTGEYSYIWGGQLEQASYPSIYQPTTAATSNSTEASLIGVPKFANRITNTGNSYVKKEYDEWSGVPIANGLVLYVDGAVSSSYIPGSNIWYNIANTSANGVLTTDSGTTANTNQISYDTTTMSLTINNNRTIASGQIRFPNIDFNALAASNNFTVMFAAKKEYYGLFGNGVGNSELFQAVNNGYNTGWRITEEWQGPQGAPYTGNTFWVLSMSPAATPSGWNHSVTDNAPSRWSIGAFSVSPTNVYGFCNNIITTRTNPGTYFGGASPTNRGFINYTSAGAGSFNGRLGFFMVYNRALSTAELTYNYNVFRKRYGL
jgi:hypothetical protein